MKEVEWKTARSKRWRIQGTGLEHGTNAVFLRAVGTNNVASEWQTLTVQRSA